MFFFGQALLVIAESDNTQSQLQHETMRATEVQQKKKEKATERKRINWNESGSSRENNNNKTVFILRICFILLFF